MDMQIKNMNMHKIVMKSSNVQLYMEMNDLQCL